MVECIPYSVMGMVGKNSFIMGIAIVKDNCIKVMSMNWGFIDTVLIMDIGFVNKDYYMDYSLLIKNLNMNEYFIYYRTRNLKKI